MAVGAALLAYQLDVLVLPRWVFSWKVFLILVGLYTGFKHSFRNAGWIFPIIIGGLFLVEDLVPGASIKPFLWPALIIGAGLWIIFKPRHTCEKHFRKQYMNRPPVSGKGFGTSSTSANFSKEDFLTASAIFGGIKKNVITKDFKGGDLVTFCGGGRYDLTHADIQGEAVLNVTQICGGVSLILPAHWRVRSEVATIFAGVSDNRPFSEAFMESNKVLVLKGTMVFAGIEIKSY